MCVQLLMDLRGFPVPGHVYAPCALEYSWLLLFCCGGLAADPEIEVAWAVDRAKCAAEFVGSVGVGLWNHSATS